MRESELVCVSLNLNRLCANLPMRESELESAYARVCLCVSLNVSLPMRESERESEEGNRL